MLDEKARHYGLLSYLDGDKDPLHERLAEMLHSVFREAQETGGSTGHMSAWWTTWWLETLTFLKSSLVTVGMVA